MITIVSMLWDGEPAARGLTYTPEHVHALAGMCARLAGPHRFVCIADRDVPGVETIPLGDAAKRGKRYPKLDLWRDRDDLGDRVLYLDLDCVLLAPLAPLLDHPEPVVLWQDPVSTPRRPIYNTSMILLTPGAHPEVADTFTGRYRKGVGSDQAWVLQVLGPGRPTWGRADGVLSFKRHCDAPERPDARVVFFHGKPKPWTLPRGHWAHKAWRLGLDYWRAR